MPRPRVRLQPLEALQAIHAGQFQIEQDDARQRTAAVRVGSGREKKIERLGPVVDHVDRIRKARLAKRAQRQLDVVRLILDQQNFHRLRARAAAIARPREEPRDRQLERVRELLDALERKIAHATLHIRDVGPVQAGPVRQLLLGDAQLGSLGANGYAEMPFEVVFHHGLKNKGGSLTGCATDDE